MLGWTVKELSANGLNFDLLLTRKFLVDLFFVWLSSFPFASYAAKLRWEKINRGQIDKEPPNRQ